MNLLLDTHAFLWYYAGSSNLSQNARLAIENPEHDFFISMASLWEISIKNGLGKLDLPLWISFSRTLSRKVSI